MTEAHNPEDFLKEFGKKNITVKLCQSILAVIPFAPRMVWYGTLEDMAKDLHPDAPAGLVERAREILQTQPFKDVLWAAESLDTGDRGISLYTGVRTAFSFFFGDRAKAFDTEAQQRADAALKALGLAYMVHRLFDGAVMDRVDHLLVLPSGRDLLVYYGAVEVALPFTKEVLEGGEHFVSGLVEKYATGSAVKLSPVAGEEGVAAAQGALPYLLELLDRVTYHSVTHLDAVVQAAHKYLPKAFTKGDNLPGLVATGADAMPVYRFMVGRLSLEAALWMAREELDPAFPERPISEMAIDAVPGARKKLEAAEAAAAAKDNPFTSPAAAPAAQPAGGNPFAQPAAQSAAQSAAQPSDGNPFAAPSAAPSGNPSAADPAQPTGGNPFAAAPSQPTSTPAGGNPFASQPAAAAATAAASAAPSKSAPAEPDDPTAEGPGEPLHASFVRREGGREQWLIFTHEGVFTDSPPASLPPVDWEAHKAAGHLVARYHRAGGKLTLRIGPGQIHTVDMVERPYLVVVDGVECRMADFDLTGRNLDGTWKARDGSRMLTFAEDGEVSDGERAGRYTLGRREITLDWQGAQERWPFLSDLKPRSRTPDVFFLGAVAYERV